MKSKFPPEIVKFIRKFPIENYLNKLGIEYKETNTIHNEQLIVAKCPKCSSINHKGNQKAYKTYINKENKNFICYVCSEQGSLLKFLSYVENCSIKQLLSKYLDNSYVESIPDELPDLLNDSLTSEDIPLEEIDLPGEFEPIFTRPQKKYASAYKYLLSRGMTTSSGGLDSKLGQYLDIRYCEYLEHKTPSQKTIYIQKRIIFPIYFDGKCLGWQGRDITGLSPMKYYISEGLPKRKILFNWDRVKESETITLCEGIFDAVACWNHNPVALFGKSLTDEQYQLLLSSPNLKTIILALDPDTKIPDKHGNIAYNKVRDLLKAHFIIKEIQLPEDKDCGDHSITEMDAIIADATTYQESELPSLLTK
jgi:DNA primase